MFRKLLLFEIQKYQIDMKVLINYQCKNITTKKLCKTDCYSGNWKQLY